MKKFDLASCCVQCCHSYYPVLYENDKSPLIVLKLNCCIVSYGAVFSCVSEFKYSSFGFIVSHVLNGLKTSNFLFFFSKMWTNQRSESIVYVETLLFHVLSLLVFM